MPSISLNPLMANGHQQVQHYEPGQIVQQWHTFLEQVALPAYERWRTDPAWRHWQLIQARLRSYCVRTQRRLGRAVFLRRA
ncbi:MAG: hypothetical protein F6J97_23895 [Leptolyngbya sp. SIO4C1]|nr:hypothetical protein [Leptolyngbya sp. SIO4C1]